MPNWVIGKVKIKGDENSIKELVDFVKSDENVFDFNKIVPMPKELETTVYPQSGKNKELIAKYGFDNWYEFHNEKWGTKWNSNEAYFDKYTNEFIFQTAWSFPFPIIEELIAKFPKIDFSVEYADEDRGYNCGKFKSKKQVIAFKEMENGSQSARRFANKVWNS